VSEQAQAGEELHTRLDQQLADIGEQARLLREQNEQAKESQVGEEHRELVIHHLDLATKLLDLTNHTLIILAGLGGTLGATGFIPPGE
jgi:hypothetical protein